MSTCTRNSASRVTLAAADTHSPDEEVLRAAQSMFTNPVRSVIEHHLEPIAGVDHEYAGVIDSLHVRLHLSPSMTIAEAKDPIHGVEATMRTHVYEGFSVIVRWMTEEREESHHILPSGETCDVLESHQSGRNVRTRQPNGDVRFEFLSADEATYITADEEYPNVYVAHDGSTYTQGEVDKTFGPECCFHTDFDPKAFSTPAVFHVSGFPHTREI